MPVFLCKIGLSDGRVVEKEFDAVSPELLRESLEDQGFHVFLIRRRPFQFLMNRESISARLSGRRFLSFNQELLVLLKSGMPILQVLDTISERMESKAVSDMLREIREDIRGGSSLSESFGKFPRVFPYLFVASIRAGEKTGDLPVTLSRYIAYQKRVETIKGKIRDASFYPILLSIAVAVVILFLLLYVIPSFTQIYADANVKLPLATRILIALSKGLGSSLPLTVPILLGAVAALRVFARSDYGSLFIDRVKLVIPFFSKLLIDYALVSFCRTFGTTISSGIPAVQAMHMSRGTLNNRVLEDKMNRAVKLVEEGGSIASSLEQTGFFPAVALRMISVGETTGSLSDMLNDVSEYYEGEVEKRLERMTTLIEPVMMMTMGLLIGGIVIAMYIPIFQLAGTVN